MACIVASCCKVCVHKRMKAEACCRSGKDEHAEAIAFVVKTLKLAPKLDVND